MKAKDSRLIVVDACIAGAATEKEDPVSRCCREALEEIYKICHRMIMTPTIRDEWDRHRTRFAFLWRGTMTRHGKTERPNPPSLRIPNRGALGLSPSEYEALEKDMPLIEGACAGDGIIVTRDDAITAIWAKCSKHIKTPKTIRWVNPVRDGTDCLRRL